MQSITKSFYIFIQKYKILPPLLCFIFGILLSDYIGIKWLVITLSLIAAILLTVVRPRLLFLLFIPIGILFTINPFLDSANNITRYIDQDLDIEGALYRPPEFRNDRTRIFLNAEKIIIDGEKESVWGKAVISADGAIPGITYGDRVRIIDVRLEAIENFNNPGRFDVKKFYERQGVYAIGFLRNREHYISFGKDPSYGSLLYKINNIRLGFGNYVRQNFRSPESSVVNAITIGDKSGVPFVLRNEFSKVGVAHMLAISGLHVGAVAVVFFFLIKWLLKRSEYLLLRFTVPGLSALITIIPIFLYTAIAGFSSSAFRAFIMISIYLLSVAVGKSENKINTLGVAAFIILILNPQALFLLSFQLSFTAVLGILLLDKIYPFKFDTLKNTTWSLVKTSAVAAFATYPFVSANFGVLPLISVPANLLIIPVVNFLLVPFSLLAFTLFQISDTLASPVIQFSVFLSELLIVGVRALLKIPYSWMAVPPPGALSWSLFVIAGAASVIQRILPRLGFLFPVSVVLFVCSIAYSALIGIESGQTKVTFLDVGVNKSTVFIELPDNKNILVDGGFSMRAHSGYTEKTVVSSFLINKGIGKIDYLILTSIDRDHLSGAGFLLKQFKVENILTNGDKLRGELWDIIYREDIHWKNLMLLEQPINIGDSTLEFITAGSEAEIRDSKMPFPVLIKLTTDDTSYLIAESRGNDKNLLDNVNGYIDSKNRRILYVPELNDVKSYDYILRTISPAALVTNDYQATEFDNSGRKTLLFNIKNSGAVTFIKNSGNLEFTTFKGDMGAVSQ